MTRTLQTAVSLSLALASCSSGGNESSPLSGQFFDALVSGLEYSSGSVSGLTNANGFFQYQAGQDVTFRVGDIVLGTFSPRPLLSPVDLGNSSEDYTQSDRILNIARFLQTIDEDANVQNGIQVSATTREAAAGQSIDFASADFDSDQDLILLMTILTSNSIVSASEAIQHAHAWLAASRAGEYAGTFATTSGSPVQGNWRCSVSNAGEVVMIVGEGDGDAGSSTAISPDGSFSATFAEGTFNGQVLGSSVTGTWVGAGSFSGSSGTFSGGLSFDALTFLDVDLLPNFEDLDGQTVSGNVVSAGDVVATFTMQLAGDSEGLYQVEMTVVQDGFQYPCSFYATSMTSTAISFRGLSTTGEGFQGTLASSGVVNGTYYNLNPNESGGSFSGSL